jgi:hypothetical protein
LTNFLACSVKVPDESPRYFGPRGGRKTHVNTLDSNDSPELCNKPDGIHENLRSDSPSLARPLAISPLSGNKIANESASSLPPSASWLVTHICQRLVTFSG